MRIENWSDFKIRHPGHQTSALKSLKFGHFAPRSGAGNLARGTRFLRTPGILRQLWNPHPERVSRTPRTPAGVRSLVRLKYPGVRKKRVPLTNLLASRPAVRVFIASLARGHRVCGRRRPDRHRSAVPKRAVTAHF